MAPIARARPLEVNPADEDTVLSIVRLLPDVLFRCVKGDDGRIYWTFNEGRLAEEFGLTTEKVRGKPLEEMFPPPVVQRLLPEFERAFQGEAREFVNELGGRHFKHFPQPVRDAHGRVVAVVGFISEVTSLVHAEEEIRKLNATLKARLDELAVANEALKESNADLEGFGSTVSHDLRSPLTVIDSVNQLVFARYGPAMGVEGIELLSRSQKATKRMSQLIEDLLRFARTGRGAIERSPVDLSRMALDVLDDLHHADPSRTVAVSVEPDMAADADPRLVRIAVENLLRNAWKFSSKTPGARIEVGHDKVGAEHAFYVRDNGAGFDPRKASRLFRAFERLHDAKDFEGTGVGLSMVHRIVKRHGGRVWATGAVGKGATFRFTLPNPRDPHAN